MSIGNSILLPPGGKTVADVHSTPLEFFARLHIEFSFTLDPCSDGTNQRVPRHFTPEVDGLSQDWSQDRVFMNPPYTECLAWMRKAYESAQAGAVVVCLIPVRTDTAWWHEYAMRGEIRFIRGRLKFGTASANAPFPSAVVVFRGRAPSMFAMAR